MAKGRPRTTFQNGHVRTYTPIKTQEAQDFIKARLHKHLSQAFSPHVPIKLTATFYRTKSKWLPKRETKPFRKPDLDNFLKLLLDSIDNMLVPDDAQITSISVRKRWSSNSEGYITLKLEEDRLD
jgi:Holliday junction resolvase RusA-like endonuclease